MEWVVITLIIISAILFALSSFFDNFVTDTYFRGRRPEVQKIFSLFIFAAALIVILIISPPTSMAPYHLVFAIGAGVISSIAAIFHLRALAHEEATGVTILIQFSPVLALLSGIFILHDHISAPQIIAIGLLLFSTIIIIFSRGKSHLKVQLKTATILLIAMFFWVSSDTLFILSGEAFDFPTGFFYFILGRFLTYLILTLALKSWRTRFKKVFREFRGRLVRTAMINEFIHFSSSVIWRIAILAAPIAIATAVVNTTQLIATFILGLVLTIIWPRFGREKLNKRKVASHFFALILSVIAILLIQLT